MKIKGVFYENGKEPKVVEFEESLSALQTYVDGYIDFIQFDDDDVDIVINDEGKLRGLPLSLFLMYKGQIIDCIVGNLLAVGHDDEGNTISIPESKIQKYMNIFSKGIAYLK